MSHATEMPRRSIDLGVAGSRSSAESIRAQSLAIFQHSAPHTGLTLGEIFPTYASQLLS